MRGVWVALNLLCFRRLLRVVACGMLASMQFASAAMEGEPPASVVEKARDFAVQAGYLVVGPPTETSLTKAVYGYRHWGVTWPLPPDDDTVSVDIELVSLQVMHLQGPMVKPGRPTTLSADQAAVRVRAALARTGVPLGGMLDVQTSEYEADEHEGARWHVSIERQVSTFASPPESASGTVDAADGRLVEFHSYLPIQRVPPTAPLIREATARVAALKVYSSWISGPSPRVALAYNAPCYLLPFFPSGIASLGYLYELYQTDEKNHAVGGLEVIVDAVTGEVWSARSLFTGPGSPRFTWKAGAPPIPRYERSLMALRLVARAGNRRWALELAMGEGQPSRPPAAGARRWQERVGPWHFDLAREDRSRTLWVRQDNGPWNVVKLTSTQVANILAEPYSAERDRIPVTTLLSRMGAVGSAPAAGEVAARRQRTSDKLFGNGSPPGSVPGSRADRRVAGFR